MSHSIAKKNTFLNMPVFWVCIFSFWFWLVMLTVTDFIVVNDSLGYEKLASIFDAHGIVGYFKNGLDREPLYPFIVSLGMKLSRWVGLSYHPVVVFLHLCILTLTQLLFAVLLRRLKINPWLTAGTLLYFALSPAVVNSGLLLYSEIATYPFSILIVLSFSRCWRQMSDAGMAADKNGIKKIVLSATYLALSFLGMTFVKASFQLISVLMLIPLVGAALSGWRHKQRGLMIKALLLLIVFSGVYLSAITAYKFANKIYNGNFAFTNRGPSILYGNAVRRTEPMDRRTMLASVGYAIGEDFCYERLGLEPCRYWHFTTSDHMASQEIQRLATSGLSSDEQNRKLVGGAVERVFKNPFAYGVFTAVEILKMFFWEFKITTYVIYPDWLDAIYAFRPLRLFLGIGMPLVTFVVIVFLWRVVLGKRHRLLKLGAEDEESTVLFSIWVMLMSFFLVHSPFFLVPRYVFTLIPLYLSVAAYILQKFFLLRHK